MSTALMMDNVHRSYRDEVEIMDDGFRPEVSRIDVTVCAADDGSQVVLLILDGRMSINGTPVVVDDNGFVSGVDGSPLPIKFQKLYFQVMAERRRRITAELAETRPKRREASEAVRRETRDRSTKNGTENWTLASECPHDGSRLARNNFKEGDMPKQSRHNLPEVVKQLVNQLSSLVNGFDTLLTTSVSSTPSTPIRSVGVASSLRNFIRHGLRRRADHVERNDQPCTISTESLGDLRNAVKEVRQCAGELKRRCCQMADGFYALKKELYDAERTNACLVKTVEVFCAEAVIVHENEMHIEDQYRTLYDRLAAPVVNLVVKKDKLARVKIRDLETCKRRLLRRVRELEANVKSGEVLRPPNESTPSFK